MFHEYSSAGRARGSCITPRWISASTSPARNRSRAFLLRRSTWWCSMSFGRPAIPVMITLRARGSERSVVSGAAESPEDVLALTQPQLDHRLDPVLHGLD